MVKPSDGNQPVSGRATLVGDINEGGVLEDQKTKICVAEEERERGRLEACLEAGGQGSDGCSKELGSVQ